MLLRTCSSSCPWLRSASNSFLVVIYAVVFTVALGAPSNGLCPVSCRCLERNTVITCYNLVHVPRIPSIAVNLNLDHNRISLLQNTSFRSTETTSGFSATRMTLRRLEVLSVEDNGLLYIETGALSTLYELRVLRLGRNHLSSLPRDLLASNRKLRVLDLHANYLAVMPDGVVRHAHGLVVLNISFNHLSSARLGDGFRHAAQLSVIDLSGNDLPTIESDSFEAMQWWDDETPRHINLSYCNIRHIRPSALRPVPRLATINLDGNPRLPQDQLESALGGIRNQPALDVIRLAHGNVTETSTLVRQLQSATNLTRLELPYNRIRSVGKKTFFFVSSLKYLNLGHNEISSIDGFGDGLARLEHLDLSFNCLERIDASTFEGLHELRVLDVSHNSLTGDFDAEPLLGLFNLVEVDVSFNRIGSFSIDEGGLESLETLSAAWNRIADLSFVRRLPHLRSLDLSHNAVERVPDDLVTTRGGALTILDRLNLSANSITDVAPGAFRQVAINVVDLSYNQLTTLINYGWSSVSHGQHESSSGGSRVHVLIVNDNFIANISDDAFNGLESSLVELRLQRNSLVSLPDASSMSRLRRLRHFDISSNPLGRFLEDLPTSMTSSGIVRGDYAGVFSRLDTVQMNDIGLSSWPSSVLKNTEMKTLDMAGNRIRFVPDNALVGLRHLRRLDLSRNRLSTFDPERAALSVSSSEAEIVFDLSDNPLDCNCALEPLCRRLFPVKSSLNEDEHQGRRVVVEQDVDGSGGGYLLRRHRSIRPPSHQTIHNRTFMCRTPSEWSNVPLEEFCADTVQCSQLVTAVAAASTGVVAVVALLLFAVLVYRWLSARNRRCAASASGKGSIYVAAAVAASCASGGGKGRGRSRLDSYQFVIDETTLTSSSNTSSGSNTTSTTSGGLLLHSSPIRSATLKLPSLGVSSDTRTGSLQANTLTNRQW